MESTIKMMMVDLVSKQKAKVPIWQFFGFKPNATKISDTLNRRQQLTLPAYSCSISKPICCQNKLKITVVLFCKCYIGDSHNWTIEKRKTIVQL